MAYFEPFYGIFAMNVCINLLYEFHSTAQLCKKIEVQSHTILKHRRPPLHNNILFETNTMIPTNSIQNYGNTDMMKNVESVIREHAKFHALFKKAQIQFKGVPQTQEKMKHLKDTLDVLDAMIAKIPPHLRRN